MRRNLYCIAVVLTVVASAGHGQEIKLTPAEQYLALRKQYDRASGSGVVLTDAQRLKFIGEVYKQRNAMAEKFLELADKYPQDPIAVEALAHAVWQVGRRPPR